MHALGKFASELDCLTCEEALSINRFFKLTLMVPMLIAQEFLFRSLQSSPLQLYYMATKGICVYCTDWSAVILFQDVGGCCNFALTETTNNAKFLFLLKF